MASRQRRPDAWLVHSGVYIDPEGCFGPGIFGWTALCDGSPLHEFSRAYTSDIAKTTCENCLKKLHRQGLDLARAARDQLNSLDPLRGI